jgi:murein DD-endopeptidase MepM/ murein hydrolase activator NlpD
MPFAALLASVALILSPVGPGPRSDDSPMLHAAPSARTAPEGSWPLRPRPPVVRFFDPPAITWGRGHRGVDLAGHVGEPVHTALAGRVSFVGRIAGIGIVVVDHGATRTTYQPVRATVRVGARVAEGAVLGTLEWHGSHCGAAACLHWGWLRGTTYLDPLLLVGAAPRPVRLLPLAG